MSYRDELEAAQERIKHLENQVRDLQRESPPSPPPAPHTDRPAPDSRKALQPSSKGRSGYAIFGVPLGLIVVVGMCVAGCPMMTRGCGAIGGETDEAMAALQRCERAKHSLGEDLHWGVVGCSNCEGESGGDPINAGCHSNSSWQMPVSGAAGRGSYDFHFAKPPGGKQVFTGGRVTMSDGESISIPATGTDCTSFKP